MYKVPIYTQTELSVHNTQEGETIEEKIERIVNNKEPIKDGAPLIYTERKEGIRPSTNIRTDRFEVAIEAADKIARSYMARREEKAGKVGEPESTQGKPETGTTDNFKVA
jgi:predicted RNA-binding protein with PIN domain